MAMFWGKYSSLAAVLLVAVVVAGTCASGAQASFNITNNCNRTVVITTANGTYTLAPGGTLTWPGLPDTFFNAPVTYTIVRIPLVTVVMTTPAVDALRQLGDRLLGVKITCDGNRNCITLYVTYKSLLPPGTTLSETQGPFCP